MARQLVSGKRSLPPRGERPSFEYEQKLWADGRWRVAGVDEVGRGALAGPVVAAACIFPPYLELPPTLRDSKRLSEAQRLSLAKWIQQHAIAWSLGAASHREIDCYGIVPATTLAIKRALCRLGEVDHILYDGRPLPGFESTWSTAVIRGDARCASIAAASILAKVVRDRVMKQLARYYPQYGWDQNVGYGTERHRWAIARFGLTPMHRLTFRHDRTEVNAEER